VNVPELVPIIYVFGGNAEIFINIPLLTPEEEPVTTVFELAFNGAVKVVLTVLAFRLLKIAVVAPVHNTCSKV
jgi:hypothetical protein